MFLLILSFNDTTRRLVRPGRNSPCATDSDGFNSLLFFSSLFGELSLIAYTISFCALHLFFFPCVARNRVNMLFARKYQQQHTRITLFFYFDLVFDFKQQHRGCMVGKRGKQSVFVERKGGRR